MVGRAVVLAVVRGGERRRFLCCVEIDWGEMPISPYWDDHESIPVFENCRNVIVIQTR
jgi:hypothetical protein